MNRRADHFDREDAHPRVTGCPAEQQAFFTIDKAREYMMRKGVFQYKEVIKDSARDTHRRGAVWRSMLSLMEKILASARSGSMIP